MSKGLICGKPVRDSVSNDAGFKNIYIFFFKFSLYVENISFHSNNHIIYFNDKSGENIHR